VPLPGNEEETRTVAAGNEHTDDGSTAELAKAEASDSSILIPIGQPLGVTPPTAETKEDTYINWEAIIEQRLQRILGVNRKVLDNLVRGNLKMEQTPHLTEYELQGSPDHWHYSHSSSRRGGL